jgi:hypothetical protein
MAIKTRQTTATGVTNKDAPLTNDELDNNFVEIIQGPTFVGQVTIDTSTENALDILADSANQTLLRLSHPTAPADAGGYFAFNSDGTTDNNVVTFGVEYSGTDYDVLNIQRSTQNVGIGTSSPNAPLTVQGGSATSATIQLKGGALANDNASIHSLYNLYLKADSSESIANRNIIFQVGTTEAMRINSSHNVGIGVTPSAWKTSSDEKVLQIDTVSLYGNNANNSYLNNNWYLNSSSQSIYIESDFATSFASEDGKFVWYQTGSGTAGNTISWTPTMTLDASGNLLVGKTSPSFGTDGIEIRADDSLYVTRSDTTAFFNRKSTDGDIVKFYKDNSAVGSIGTQGGTLEVGSGDVYLQFNGTNDWIKPVDGSGSNKPNVDLGTSGAKFKDLYLSGTAYIGGNAALTTADEGSGNGLDADLLDGQHGSYYQVARTALGYVDVATGSYGTIKVDDDRGVTWAGYAIRDHWVLMFNGAERGGIYNDTDNEWAIQCYQNAQVQLYYNGGLVCKTTSGGLDLTVDTTDVLNFTANSTNSNRGISFNSRTALSASNTGDWLRLNNNSEFTVGTWSPKKIASGEQILGGTSDVTSGGQVAVSAGTSPYLSFHEGSTRRAYVQYLGADNTLFIYNEEAGNLKFRGNAGTVNFDFETTGATNTGRLFVDADDFAMRFGDNESIVYGRKNSHTWLYYNGDFKIRTESDGLSVRNALRSYDADLNLNRVGSTSARLRITSGSTISDQDLTVNSDERIKDNIELIDSALDKVQAIRGVTYNRTDTDDPEKEHTGVIAQDVEKVLPQVVHEDDQGIKSVAYGNMVGLLIEAIKEQQTQIDDLKAEVTRLKGFE